MAGIVPVKTGRDKGAFPMQQSFRRALASTVSPSVLRLR
jgi:hypothetical protein